MLESDKIFYGKMFGDLSPLNVDDVTPVLRQVFEKERKEIRNLITVFPHLKGNLVFCDEILFDLNSGHRILFDNFSTSIQHS